MRIIICLISLFSLSAIAQQEPHYTQYMYNMSVVNPGYVIDEPGLIQVGSLYRTQWVGMDGAPKTANVFAHIPLNEKIELSVNYMNDRIGKVLNENVFNIDGAYKIKLKNDLNISFGMKIGVDNLRFDFSNTNVSTDPLFQNTNKTVIGIGAGFFVFKEQYYIGLSSPNFFPADLTVDSDALYKTQPHLFLIGGYVFNMNDNIKLKPSAVVKQTFGAPLTFDVSANAMFNDVFEIGVSYRYQDAIAGLAGFNITPSLKIGYAYDFNTSQLNDFNNGSHEFVLLYTFDILGLSKKYSSPRFY